MVGGVVVGMFHTVTEVVDMIRAAQPQPSLSNRNKIDWLAGIKPFIKALQAALTLGTGLSLGPEGPSVDIGKSWAHGFSSIMKHSKERRIALVAAGAAAGIASGQYTHLAKESRVSVLNQPCQSNYYQLHHLI